MELKTEARLRTKEMQLEALCSDCGEILNQEESSNEDSLSICNSCRSIFSMEEAAFEKRRRGHPIFLVPEGTEVLKLISSLEITSSWLRASKRDKIKFDFIFASVFGFISSMGLLVGIFEEAIIISATAFFFFLGSLILIYIFVANLINKTQILVSEDALKITHKPLKFLAWKEYNIPKNEIRQLYVKQYLTNRYVNNKALSAYGLYIVKENDKHIKILDDMNRETSLFLEQEIEEFLNIKDKSVQAELMKKA